MYARRGSVRIFSFAKARSKAKELGWIEKLKITPFTPGEQTVVEENGREIQVCAIPGFLVYHWAEHLVEAIHIVRIEKT